MDRAPSNVRWVDRPLVEADIAAVVAMEQDACTHALHAWTPENYRSSIRAGYWARVRCEAESGQIVAVCVAMDGFDEVHLLNIAVARAWHGQGLARALLAILEARCHDRQAARIWLEVRPSNVRARALYTQLGYESVGLRKQYYPAEQGREDAIVMRRVLPGGPDALD
ncbi:ribosomal protein S18-alanine N-acetyltransferase [Aquabacterium sp. A3]|uniref:ribosomal protein S18-alanine N-acetyltransferase n=1 Tax=Aquabacterium sp. A3 TaxID=3132829 RepID=UPI0031196755